MKPVLGVLLINLLQMLQFLPSRIKGSVLISVNQKQKICFGLQKNDDRSYLYVNKADIHKFKGLDNIIPH